MCLDEVKHIIEPVIPSHSAVQFKVEVVTHEYTKPRDSSTDRERLCARYGLEVLNERIKLGNSVLLFNVVKYHVCDVVFCAHRLEYYDCDKVGYHPTGYHSEN